jgi:hypothetical protein
MEDLLRTTILRAHGTPLLVLPSPLCLLDEVPALSRSDHVLVGSGGPGVERRLGQLPTQGAKVGSSLDLGKAWLLLTERTKDSEI